MQRRWTRPVVALAAIALLASGCGGDDEDATDTTEPAEVETEAEATELAITAVDYRYEDAPTTIESGLIELTVTNDGTVAHELVFAEIGDTDVATFIKDFGPVVEGEGGGPIPEYTEKVSGAIGDIPAGETLTKAFVLPAGEYVMFCTFTGAAPDPAASTTTAEGEGGGEAEGENHYKLGMAQPVTVTEGNDSAELPEADGSVIARDYEFDVDVQAGQSTMLFRNDGPDQIHHAVFFPFAEGVTEDAAATALDAFFSSQGDGPPPPEFDFEGGPKGLKDSGVFSAGLGEVYDQEFTAGRMYAVVCFLSDRAGGPPHAVDHDMKKIFTVE